MKESTSSNSNVVSLLKAIESGKVTLNKKSTNDEGNRVIVIRAKKDNGNIITQRKD